MYPEVSLLKQVKGSGTQIALTYVLTIEDPHRFLKSREVGLFSGVATWADLAEWEQTHGKKKAKCLLTSTGLLMELARVPAVLRMKRFA